MPFEWADAKERSNISKHGVSFALAQQIFDGPVVTLEDDRFDYGERRQVSIGCVGEIVVLAVVHTDRNGSVRIISARTASRKERLNYERAIRQGPRA